MTEHVSSSVALAQLAHRRRLVPSALSEQAGVSEPEVSGVLDGARPTPSLLRAIAPAFGLHAADVFVIAGVPVPDDLAPLDPAAARSISWLMNVLSRLPAKTSGCGNWLRPCRMQSVRKADRRRSMGIPMAAAAA